MPAKSKVGLGEHKSAAECRVPPGPAPARTPVRVCTNTGWTLSEDSDSLGDSCFKLPPLLLGFMVALFPTISRILWIIQWVCLNNKYLTVNISYYVSITLRAVVDKLVTSKIRNRVTKTYLKTPHI